MQETKQITHADDEIDLRELFSAIWAGKWFILVVTTIFSVAAVFYALQLPDVYKSEVTLAPAEDGGLKVPGQLGGLAALAGVNLGGMGGGDKTNLALEILKSRDFIGRFIEKNDLYLPIMAAKGWDRTNNQLILDPEIYDINTQQWVRKMKQPFQSKPSKLEGIEAFNKLFSVSQDKTSGIVKLNVDYLSPYLAKDWAEKMVKAINEDMRTRELAEAEKSIAYLNSQIAQTSLSDVRSMLFTLIEEQTKTLMLASVREEFVFKTVDPAVVAEKKAKPARALICILAAMLGFIVSGMIILIRHFSRK